MLLDIDTTPLSQLCPPGMSNAELWETWLTCPAVHAYESGKTNEAEFAMGVLAAFKSSLSPKAFLESFAAWPLGFYPGITDLLKSLRSEFTLGYLSNSNPIHYARFQKEWDLNSYFDYHFASHLIGMAKPEAALFTHLIDLLPCHAGEILFVDDNRLNVEAAKQAGLKAEIVRGPEALFRTVDAISSNKNRR